MALILTQITTLLLAISMLLVIRSVERTHRGHVRLVRIIAQQAESSLEIAQTVELLTDTLRELVEALPDDDEVINPAALEAFRRQFKN